MFYFVLRYSIMHEEAYVCICILMYVYTSTCVIDYACICVHGYTCVWICVRVCLYALTCFCLLVSQYITCQLCVTNNVQNGSVNKYFTSASTFSIQYVTL